MIIKGKKVIIVLSFFQVIKSDWATTPPFFAKYDDKAIWLVEFKLAFYKLNFFFEEGL